MSNAEMEKTVAELTAPGKGILAADESGEIVVRGPNVMQGYYARREETAAILRDGWLHTGDLGRLDQDGYLCVTGRLKEILVLASGKKVNPATIEETLQAAPSVREAGVFLDGDALHALIVPNWEALPMADRSAAEAWLRSEVLTPYNDTVSPYRRVARLTLTRVSPVVFEWIIVVLLLFSSFWLLR